MAMDIKNVNEKIADSDLLSAAAIKRATRRLGNMNPIPCKCEACGKDCLAYPTDQCYCVYECECGHRGEI